MKCIVIGGGAAGMFCAGQLAEQGHNVILLEKNEKLGKKMYITGKGRCNITNDCDFENFLKNVVSNSKFMMSAIHKFSPQDTMNFIETHGTPLKVERGNRVFPYSDKSSDIIKVFSNYLKENNVDIRLNAKVNSLIKYGDKIIGVKIDDEDLLADIVVVATGGKSYPLTGSTGDGYKFAKDIGINVTELKPALCPIILDIGPDLAGLSLKNVQATVLSNNEIIASDFGEMLFTHKGASGPIILSLSSFINKYYVNNKFNKTLYLSIDLKPALNVEQLDQRLLREFSQNQNMEIKNIMPSLLPKSLIVNVLNQANIKASIKANSITKEQRKALIECLKGLKYKILDLDKIELSIITSGGIDIKEISPKDMQSKKYKGLYFVGEVLDVDALTGGFNLQIALSTAYVMANSLKND